MDLCGANIQSNFIKTANLPISVQDKIKIWNPVSKRALSKWHRVPIGINCQMLSSAHWCDRVPTVFQMIFFRTFHNEKQSQAKKKTYKCIPILKHVTKIMVLI